MDYDSQKSSINFFKKQIDLEQEKSNSVKIWAMILFTMNQTFSKIKLVHFIAVGAMIVGCLFITDYIRHSDSRAILQKSQLEFSQTQQIKKDAAAQTQAKMNSEKQDSILKQKVETIAKITPEQIILIKEYITKMREKEVAKLNEVYWTYVFINNTDKALNMEMVNSIVRNQINVVNDFYKNRLLEISSTYDFVKAGNIELLTPTHDGSSSMDKLLTWNTITKTDSGSYLPSTDKIVAESTQYLRSPVKIHKYLEENKAMIENNRMFK